MGNNYILEKNPNEKEIHRLKNIQEAVDPNTIKLLEIIKLSSGDACLELGAGGGSIFNWLGKRVGKNGKAIAIDKNTYHIKDFTNPPYEVIEGEFLDIELNTKFDLIHCRYVLIHNQKDKDILKKMHALLKPNGVIVIEEPDFTCSKLLNQKPDIDQNCVNDASCDVFRNAGLDPAYGLNLPQKIIDIGFNLNSIDSTLHFCNGGSPIAKMCAESVDILSKEFMDTGKANKKNIQQYIKNSQDPNYWSIYYATISIIANKFHA